MMNDQVPSGAGKNSPREGRKMKTTLQDPRNHWRNVGATAARQGLPVEAALTKCESINALIREGYNRHIRRIARHAAHQAEIEARNRKRRFNRLAGW